MEPLSDGELCDEPRLEDEQNASRGKDTSVDDSKKSVAKLQVANYSQK